MKVLLYFCLILITIGALFSACTDDKECPICPEISDTDSLSACDVYISARGDRPYIFHYNTSNPGVFDTISLDLADEGFGQIILANDGVHLLSWFYDINVYNLESREKVKTLPHSGRMIMSPKGNYIATTSGTDVYIYDGSTFEEVNHISPEDIDSLGWYVHCWSLDETKLGGVYDWSKIMIYDLVGDSLYRSLIYIDPYGNVAGERFGIYRLQLAENAKLAYLLANYGYGVGRFYVYDLESDSTIQEYNATYISLDNMHITPDGSQVIITDPGYPVLGELGSQDIIFFDVSEQVMASRVPWPRFEPGRFDISADSRYSFIINADYSGLGFAVIDNVNHQLLDYMTSGDLDYGYTEFAEPTTCRRVLTN